MDLSSLSQFITPSITVITFFWGIYQFFANKYNYLKNDRDILILNKILLPHFETIEINLFEEITEENYPSISNSIRLLLKDIRQEKLFFYLPSHLTHHLIALERIILSNKTTNDYLKNFNRYYISFSNNYFDLSWKTRRNLKIERDHYSYLQNLTILNEHSKLHYHISPRMLRKWGYHFLLFYILIYIILADSNINFNPGFIAFVIFLMFLLLFLLNLARIFIQPKLIKKLYQMITTLKSKILK